MNSNETPTDWPRLFGSTVYNLRVHFTVLAGYVRLLQNERVGPLNDAQRKMLEELNKSVRRAQDVVAHMDTITWASEGKLKGHVEVVELGSVVHEVVSAVAAGLPSEFAWEVRAGEGKELVEANRADLVFAARTVMRCVAQTVRGYAVAVWVTAPVVAARPERWVIIAAPDQLERALDPDSLEPLTDRRTRFIYALEMAAASRRIAANGGLVSRFREQIPGAVIALPHVSAE